MSSLPQLESVLKLNVLCSMYIETISKPVIPDMTSFGWNHDCSIVWVDGVYPKEIE